MDIARTKQLAGLPRQTPEDVLFRQLNEVVQLPDDLSIEELTTRLEHCKRALSLCSKLAPADRKKWLSATFVNLNKVTGALKRMLRDSGAQSSAPVSQAQPVQPPSPQPVTSTQGPAPLA